MLGRGAAGWLPQGRVSRRHYLRHRWSPNACVAATDAPRRESSRGPAPVHHPNPAAPRRCTAPPQFYLPPSPPTGSKPPEVRHPGPDDGAGPTGLVLAIWLTRLGVRLRIIDRTSEAGTTSRALVVHARTLELYRQVGLA